MRMLPPLMMVMLAGLANAAGGNACGVVFSQEYVAIFLLGIVISVLFVSLIYMFGKIAHNPEVEATTVAELQQIGVTIAIAIMLGGALEIACNLQVSAKGVALSTDSGGLYAQASATYEKLIANTLAVYLDLSNALMERAMLGSTFGGASVLFVTIYMSPYAANSMIAMTIAPIAQSVLIAYFAEVFQYTLFMVAQSDVFLALIPVGLCLRAFPITRKFGGTLLAVAIGLSIIYPLIVSFTYTLVNLDDIGYQSISIGNETFAYIAPFAAVMLSIQLLGQIFGTTAISTIPTALLLGGSGLLTMGLSAGIDSAMLSEYFTQVYSAYASIMLYAFFFPAMQVLITAALVRSLAGALGSEIDISGIMRAV
ncbi:MAG: hypothetical protein N3H30_01015 [Candidatus Micrarchaeota archaeon]|nr:hypothetical protein [Candidatus Micrarchaeota archaeon]